MGECTADIEGEPDTVALVVLEGVSEEEALLVGDLERVEDDVSLFDLLADELKDTLDNPVLDTLLLLLEFALRELEELDDTE